MKLFVNQILLLLVVLSVSEVHAKLQGQQKLDSLLNQLPKQKEDTNKVNIQNNLSYVYYIVNPDEGKKYGQQALDLATKLKWKNGIATALLNIGTNCWAKSEYQNALEYYSKSLELNKEIGNKNGMATVFADIGLVYSDLGEYQKALDYHFKALILNEEIGNKKSIANNSINIGNLYRSQLENPIKAMEYHFKALKIHEANGDKGLIAAAKYSIASDYEWQEDYANALEYLSGALKLYEELGQKGGIAAATCGIGKVYEKQKNYILAIEYFQRGLKLYEEVKDKAGEAWVLKSIGVTFIDIMEDSTTKRKGIKGFFETGLTTYKPSGMIPTTKDALLNKAIDYLQRGILISKEINKRKYLKECYKGLARAYKLKGDYKKSLDATENYYALKDTLESKENNEQMVRMGVKNDYERKHLADSLKSAEKEHLAVVKLQKQKMVTYVGFAGVLILAVFSFFIVIERRKSERSRKQSDELLLNILPSAVARELKTQGSSDARHFDNVTVLFTDFVNFTSAGERMNAKRLVDELHACFRVFDDITSKYGIEKIKTIGDAYLAVAGLPTEDVEHGVHIVKAAIEINNFMQDRLAKLGNDTFEIRIGIHSGSVVAGIVGVKKFAYDIWGDAVNTAARMEQNCEAGKINISASTYELVKGKFSFEYRGEIEAKGKGMMRMYYVNSL